MKHLGLKILPFAILLANCDNGDNEQNDDSADPQDTQSKKDPQDIKPSPKKPDDPQTSDDSDKPTPEKTIEEAIEKLVPTFEILQTINFKKIAQTSNNPKGVNLDSLSQEHKDALDNLDRFFGENYETIKSNLFKDKKLGYFWDNGFDLLNLGCVGKYKNVVKIIAEETSWIKFNAYYDSWEKPSGIFFLENCDLETIKLWYEKHKDAKFDYGGLPPKENKKTWYDVWNAAFQNPDLEVTKFIVDSYSEIIMEGAPLYISDVLNSLIPFKGKPSYSFLDEKLASVEIKNEQCKYLLEKYPDYKLPPEVLYIRLKNEKDDSEILRTLLGRFDQWEEFANKCCESDISKIVFGANITYGTNFNFLKKFAQEKGVDLLKVLQEKGLTLV